MALRPRLSRPFSCRFTVFSIVAAPDAWPASMRASRVTLDCKREASSFDLLGCEAEWWTAAQPRGYTHDVLLGPPPEAFDGCQPRARLLHGLTDAGRPSSA